MTKIIGALHVYQGSNPRVVEHRERQSRVPYFGSKLPPELPPRNPRTSTAVQRLRVATLPPGPSKNEGVPTTATLSTSAPTAVRAEVQSPLVVPKEESALTPSASSTPPRFLELKDLGEKKGQGAEKSVFQLRHYPNFVVCIPAHEGPLTATPERLQQEIRFLDQLKGMGFPVVDHYGIVQVGKEKGILKRFIPGLRDAHDPGVAENLNSRSLDDINVIEEALRKNDIYVMDMDLPVGGDGHVYVDDPFDIRPGLDQSNIDALDRLRRKLPASV